MAGDWLKLEHTTLDKPEIFQIAEALDLDPEIVLTKILRVWIWFDQHSLNGTAPVTVRHLLDRKTGVKGIIDAMVKVGWAFIENDELRLPGFNRHTGVTGKKRAYDARRQASHRAESQKSHKIVTKLSRHNIPRALRREIYTRDEERCVYCGFEKGTSPPAGPYVGAKIGLDHVIPFTRGGEDSLENLVTCCSVCNQIKGDRTPEESGFVVTYVTKMSQKIVTNVAKSALPREEKRRTYTKQGGGY